MLLALWTWFVETLRAHPELTVFLALGIGFGIGPRKVAGVRPRERDGHAPGRRRDRPVGHHRRRPHQERVLPAVPVRGRLRGRAAVLQRHRQGRPQADRLLADRARLLPARAGGLRLDRRAGRRLRGRPVCRVPDHLGVDRRGVGSDRPPWPDRRGGEGPIGCRPHRVRRHLHLRHDRLGRPAGAARPETDRRRSAGRVCRVRAADGRRRGLRGRGLFGLPRHRAACLRHRRGVARHRPAGPRALPGSPHLRRASASRRPADRG